MSKTTKRIPKYPSSKQDLQKWEEMRTRARKEVQPEAHFKRKPLDCWEFIEKMGLTLAEFRLLYVIANGERWNKRKKDKRENGCYLSGDTIANRTGMSKTKVYETLKILRQANIIEQTGRRASRTKTGRAFAGASNEYQILPFDQWVTPPELVTIRERITNN